uniref:Uncharacterized protein n=1 Tax=Helianthus annuus TaxID=4232 RepID=A0A251RQZ1_HELAN
MLLKHVFRMMDLIRRWNYEHFYGCTRWQRIEVIDVAAVKNTCQIWWLLLLIRTD